VDTGGAARTGLSARPVSETVADTWAWMRAENVQPGDPAGRFGGNGIDADKERRILAAWHAR
jgi:2'-hydroxyisoflavone reductase